MILTGAIANSLGVLAGGIAGLAVHRLSHRGIPQRYRDRIMHGIGLCVIYIAAGGLLSGSKTMVTILSLVLGAILGEWLDLDGKIAALSQWLEVRFSSGQSGGFSQGFMAATLLFCVGTMGVLGALDSGLRGDHATLLAKAAIDAICACIFASTMGVGVLFSAIPLLLYQGGIALLASVVGPALTDEVLAEMNTAGSLLLLGLSLDLLDIKHLKLMNYLPAVFLPILLCPLLP